MAHSATATAQPCSCRRHFSSAGRLSLARAAGEGFLIEGDHHQIEVRRMASQTIGEAAAIPPAALALAANDDFAEVMFAGVMEDRFLFRRVGEGGGFGPQLLGQTQRGENSPPPAFR